MKSIVIARTDGPLSDSSSLSISLVRLGAECFHGFLERNGHNRDEVLLSNIVYLDPVLNQKARAAAAEGKQTFTVPSEDIDVTNYHFSMPFPPSENFACNLLYIANFDALVSVMLLLDSQYSLKLNQDYTLSFSTSHYEERPLVDNKFPFFCIGLSIYPLSDELADRVTDSLLHFSFVMKG